MAYTYLTPYKPDSGSSVAVFAEPATSGNYYDAGWQSLLLIRASNSASLSASLHRNSIEGVALPKRVVTVQAGSYLLVGGLDPTIYTASDGYYYIDWSSTTGSPLVINLKV